MGVADDSESYGARLYAELKKCDVVVSRWNFATIEALKRANREETVRFFRASDDDVLQQIKTREPTEVVQYVIEKAKHTGDSMPFPFVCGF